MSKEKIKIISLKALTTAPFTSLLASNKNPVILMYHGVTHTKSISRRFWTQLDSMMFEKQMQYLKQNYNPIKLSQLCNLLTENIAFPKRISVVTFDDGYANNYFIAKPILEKYQIPATFFCVSDFIETNRLLWPDKLQLYIQHLPILNDNERAKIIHKINTILNGYGLATPNNLLSLLKSVPYQLRNEVLSTLTESFANQITASDYPDLKGMQPHHVIELSQSRLFDIGAHSVSHEILTQCPAKEARRQIVESLENLSALINSQVKLFAYPDGQHSLDIMNIVRQTGCSCALTTQIGHVKKPYDLYSLPRVGIGSDSIQSLNYFKALLNGTLPDASLHPYRILKGHIKNNLSPSTRVKIPHYYSIRHRLRKPKFTSRNKSQSLNRFLSSAQKITSIHFVCQGNICRSAFAEAFLSSCLNNTNIQVTSSGVWARTGRRAEISAIDAAERFGLDLNCHRATKTTRQSLQENSILICFENWHIAACTKICPQARHKIFLFSTVKEKWEETDDPYGKGIDEFMKCFVRIANYANTLIQNNDQLRKLANHDVNHLLI